VPQRLLTDDQGDEAAKLYRAGTSVRELMDKYGVGRDPIRVALKHRSVPMRKNGPPPGRPRTGMSYVPQAVRNDVYAQAVPEGWDELP
jgi:hypothetical protein